jgi:hypothetical protein
MGGKRSGPRCDPARRHKAERLRARGLTFREIGRRLGMTSLATPGGLVVGGLPFPRGVAGRSPMVGEGRMRARHAGSDAGQVYPTLTRLS